MRPWPGTLTSKRRCAPSSGWRHRARRLGLPGISASGPEMTEGRSAELHDHLGHLAGHRLAGAQIEGDAVPTPRLDEEPHCRVGGRPGALGHVRLVQIAVVLGGDGIGDGLLRRPAADGLQHVNLAVAQGVGVGAAWRLHRDDCEDLEQVVLHHVPHDARRVVVAGPVAHGQLLGDGDLHVVDVVAVPEGLEEDVAEPEDQKVLHRLLAQVVVNAVDLLLAKEGVDGAVQRLGGGKVAAEGLLDDDAPPAVALVRHAAGAHVAKGDLVEGGRYRKVVEPVGDAIEPALELG